MQDVTAGCGTPSLASGPQNARRSLATGRTFPPQSNIDPLPDMWYIFEPATANPKGDPRYALVVPVREVR